MPVHYPEEAGKPYRPSNGTEGMIFEEMFCLNCAHCGDDEDDDRCEIMGLAMLYNIDDPDYPKEWKFDANGRPTCTKFEAVE